MHLPRAIALCVWSVAGCLSLPPPASELGARDGGLVDANPGDGPGRADASPDAAGGLTPFPAQGVNLRNYSKADLNRDGKEDLVLWNYTGDPQTQGAYILLGRERDFGTGYDAFVPLPTAAPQGLGLVDVDGDSTLDLLVIGASGENTFALVLLGTSATAFADPLTLTVTKPLGDFTVPSPAYITAVHLDATSQLHLLLGGTTVAQTGLVSGWTQTEFERTSLLAIKGPGANDAFAHAFHLLPRPSGVANADDVVMVSQDSVRWYQNDGAGDLNATVSSAAPVIDKWLHAASADFDGDGCSEIVASTALAVDVITLSCAARGTIAVHRYDEVPNELGRGGTLDGLSVANVDGSGSLDLVVLDNVDTGDTWVEVHRDLYLDDSDTFSTAQPKATKQYGSYKAEFLTAGDFDGDGKAEILTFDVLGQSRCVELVGAALAPCGS